jgi:hypothetical protein
MIRYLLALVMVRICCRPHRCNPWNDTGTGPMVLYVTRYQYKFWCPVCLGGYVSSTSLIDTIRQWRRGRS